MRNIITALALLTAGAAQALDGAQMHAMCAPGAGTPSKATCKAYLNGMVDGLRAGVGLGAYRMGVDKSRLEMICIPDGLKTEALAAVVWHYLSENPEEQHKPASWAVPAALGRTFNCKNAAAQ